MEARAEADYPEETCGLLLEEGGSLVVRPMENVQDRVHLEDPERHPADAKRAYHFDTKELLGMQKDIDSGRYTLRAIYHSHPDEDAYFSPTDNAAATQWGGPSFPGAVYLVFSVRGGKVADLKAFDWSDAEGKYVEVPFRRE